MRSAVCSVARVRYIDLIGRPWRRGGSDPKTGIDCWGVVEFMYRRAGLYVPKLLPDVARESCKVDVAHADPVAAHNGFRIVQWPFEAVDDLDIVASTDERDRVHVGVVVDCDRLTVLSARPRVGVYSARIDKIRGVEGVYRAEL